MSDRGSLAVIDRMQIHLAALPGGIGCRHLVRERDGFDAGVLVDLALVKPIVSRVPRCIEHGCPWLPSCAHWRDFEPDASGAKSGVKYRPTAEGVAAATNAGLIARLVAELPAALDVLELLKGGPATIFTLNSLWLERARVAARNGENPDAAGINRVTLGAVVGMLVELEMLIRDEDGVTYRVVDPLQ